METMEETTEEAERDKHRGENEKGKDRDRETGEERRGIDRETGETGSRQRLTEK